MRSIPRYIPVSLGLMLLWMLLVYDGSRLALSGREMYCMATALDDMLPSIPFFSIVYLLAFVQWALGYYYIAVESKALCYRTLATELTAKTVSLFCFLLLPTTMERPVLTGTDFFSMLNRLIYALDPPNNLFPSLHCLESWFCMRYAWQVKKLPRWYPWVMLVFTLLVMASTIFVKQHVVADVLAAVVLGEICIRLAQKLKPEKICFRIEARLARK